MAIHAASSVWPVQYLHIARLLHTFQLWCLVPAWLSQDGQSLVFSNSEAVILGVAAREESWDRPHNPHGEPSAEPWSGPARRLTALPICGLGPHGWTELNVRANGRELPE